MENVPSGTCEEIDFPFFAGDRKCIAKCQRSLVGHLIAKFFKAQTRLFPKIDFFACSRRDVYCYFAEEGEVRESCYCTLYVSGYGNDEASARLNWGVGLKLMGNAIVQLSRAG